MSAGKEQEAHKSLGGRLLDLIERAGNKLPDPAVLFVIALLLVWVVSALLAGHKFEVPSRTGPVAKEVVNQLSGKALTQFLTDMVKTFTGFHPLGVVLVALLGVGVAEHSGSSAQRSSAWSASRPSRC